MNSEAVRQSKSVRNLTTVEFQIMRGAITCLSKKFSDLSRNKKGDCNGEHGPEIFLLSSLRKAVSRLRVPYAYETRKVVINSKRSWLFAHKGGTGGLVIRTDIKHP